MARNKMKESARRHTDAYRQSRRMYNGRPEVKLRKQIKAAMKKKRTY